LLSFDALLLLELAPPDAAAAITTTAITPIQRFPVVR
jgi:hypothetical protein